MKRGTTDGTRWDARKIRRAREFGWFRQHEAEMIEAARNRQAQARRLNPSSRCARCGGVLTPRNAIEGVAVRDCGACGWISVDRAQLEELLAHAGPLGRP
ncbi:MAG TPA: zf-TFIIB domain-containing protein [Thermoanaerobaculia bacterium]